MRLVSRVEPDVEDAMLAQLRPADVMWDVGANIGWFALLAARAVGPSGNVTAFEPSPSNAAQIKANASRNGLRLTVVGAAVSDVIGWAQFDDRSSLTGRLSETGQSVVPTVTLDDWAARHEAPSLLKLDVEGAEIAALTGARRLLAESRPVILCECHGTQLEINEILCKAGYAVTAVEMPCMPIEDAPWWVHLLATPDGSG
jgi:FkbM family methyltransferase